MTKSEIEASNLKVILHSKRANIYYLEKIFWNLKESS